MKIGSKIALFYTGITICMLTCIMVVFYFFIYNYINRLYDSYLADKAYLTALKHWEKDEVDESSYEIIRQEYEGLLPQAQELLLNTESMETDYSWKSRFHSVIKKRWVRHCIIRIMKVIL